MANGRVLQKTELQAAAEKLGAPPDALALGCGHGSGPGAATTQDGTLQNEIAPEMSLIQYENGENRRRTNMQF